MPTILEQGKAQISEIVTTKPNSFTVGAYTDGKAVTAQLTYDRKWSNGWGFTAYAKAWWNDASVTPNHRSGAEAGIEGRKSF